MQLVYESGHTRHCTPLPPHPRIPTIPISVRTQATSNASAGWQVPTSIDTSAQLPIEKDGCTTGPNKTPKGLITRRDACTIPRKRWTRFDLETVDARSHRLQQLPLKCNTHLRKDDGPPQRLQLCQPRAFLLWQ